MQKKLLALAVACAIAAPVAMADATVYGNVGMSVDFVNGGAASSDLIAAATDSISNGTTGTDGGGFYAGEVLSFARAMKQIAAAQFLSDDRRTRVTSNNSFLGIKGSEKINDNLSAVYQWEFSVNFDQQNTDNTSASDLATTQSNRNTFLGLASKHFGTVTLGLQDTPLKTSTGPMDMFGNTVADYRSIIGAMNGSIRAQNSVMYTTPTFAGITFKALYGAGNEGGNGLSDQQSGGSAPVTRNAGANPHITSMSLGVVAGPATVVAAWEKNLQTGAVSDVVGGLPSSLSVPDASTPVMTPTFIGGTGVNSLFAIFPDVITSTVNGGRHDFDTETKTLRAGLGLKFGGTRIGAAWEGTKAEVVSRNVVSTGLVSNSTGDYGGLNFSNAGDDIERGQAERKAYSVGAAQAFGKLTVMAAYAKAYDVKGINSWNAGTDSGAKQISGGVSFALSKTTSMFGIYSKMKNETNGLYGLAGGATGVAGVTPAGAGEDPTAISVGMRTTF